MVVILTAILGTLPKQPWRMYGERERGNEDVRLIEFSQNWD